MAASTMQQCSQERSGSMAQTSWVRRLLQRSWRFFSHIFENPDRESDAVGRHEELTRFIFSRSHFSSIKNVVKHAAFMPGRDGKTSVYRTTDLSQLEAWNLALQTSRGRSESLKALASLSA